MAACYPPYDVQQGAVSAVAAITSTPRAGPPHTKDYTRPLHVDCSVEYELPNQARPPAGARSEPLLMIHPCYFRKIESQRRSPFVNNLPAARGHQTSSSSSSASSAATAVVPTKRRAHHHHHHHHQHHHQQQQQQQQQQQVTATAPQSQQAAAPCPVHYGGAHTQLWEPLVPAVAAAQQRWPSDKSPEKGDDGRPSLAGKYRQYLRAHRLHPYVTSSVAGLAAFPQIQQVCYNV